MDPLSDTLREIAAALDRVGIRYAIGGSLASSARSVWRTTMDVDLVAAATENAGFARRVAFLRPKVCVKG